MNEILIVNTPSGYVARFVGPHAVEIRQLFGMDELALPWDSSADSDTVLADVQVRNPGIVVRMSK